MLNVELVFSLAGVFAIVGWLSLLVSPLIPVWSNRIAGQIIPALLSAGYVTLALFFPSDNEGGFGTFAEVTELFSNQNALLAGWVHFLAFDLLVGAWICSMARSNRIRFWFVVPCLPLTFMFGPAGFLLFFVVRLAANNEMAGKVLRDPKIAAKA